MWHATNLYGKYKRLKTQKAKLKTKKDFNPLPKELSPDESA
jgi:hypothetical protein